jgi:hypothetical protein
MSEREWILYILMEDRVLHAVFSCHSPGGPIASLVLDMCVTASFPLTLDIKGQSHSLSKRRKSWAGPRRAASVADGTIGMSFRVISIPLLAGPLVAFSSYFFSLLSCRSGAFHLILATCML